MSSKAVTYWTLTCDWPACREEPIDDDYSAWANPEDAELAALDGSWWQARGDEERHYCDRHPTQREGDGPALFHGPYLLIHEDEENVTYTDPKESAEPRGASGC